MALNWSKMSLDRRESCEKASRDPLGGARSLAEALGGPKRDAKTPGGPESRLSATGSPLRRIGSRLRRIGQFYKDFHKDFIIQVF